MKAEIIAIGTELLMGHTVNTNATYISEKLNENGIDVFYHTVVGDNETRIIDMFTLAASRSDLVICTGGLGPTDDDISNESLAKFLRRNIDKDSNQVKILEEKFHKRGITNIPEINYKQAQVIEGAQIVPNPIGTAIGMFVETEKTIFISFPGVPCEMEDMLNYCLPILEHKLKALNQDHVINSRKIKMTNITESKMAQNILDHYSKLNLPNPFTRANPSLAPYASLGEVYVRLTAKAKTHKEALALIAAEEKILEEILGPYIYGYDEDTIPSILARELKTRNLSIAFAESCTGGLISKIMTDMPGASEYIKLNLITYANQAKIQMLGVNKQILEKYGAVSAECAKAMVEGLATISNSDINLSITGIAGPDGASEDKPIGTVYMGIILPGSSETIVEKLKWTSQALRRDMVRELAAIKALYRVYQLLRQS